MRGASTGPGRVPEMSKSVWAEKCDIKRDPESHDVVYSRYGAEHIRDRGDTLEMRPSATVKDAVSLCKEQGVEKIDVLFEDPRSARW